MANIIDDALELAEDTQKDKFLTFLLGSEEYGIDIKYVTEIIGMQPITEIPELPCYVKGIINLRGKIIPVIDVRLRFNKESRNYDDRTCTVVIDIGDISVGLIVDAVSEVLKILGENIVPPPQVANNSFQHKYIKGIGKVGDNVKLLLDCDKLFDTDETDQLATIN